MAANVAPASTSVPTDVPQAAQSVIQSNVVGDPISASVGAFIRYREAAQVPAHLVPRRDFRRQPLPLAGPALRNGDPVANCVAQQLRRQPGRPTATSWAFRGATSPAAGPPVRPTTTQLAPCSPSPSDGLHGVGHSRLVTRGWSLAEGRRRPLLPLAFVEGIASPRPPGSTMIGWSPEAEIVRP